MTQPRFPAASVPRDGSSKRHRSRKKPSSHLFLFIPFTPLLLFLLRFLFILSERIFSCKYRSDSSQLTLFAVRCPSDIRMSVQASLPIHAAARRAYRAKKALCTVVCKGRMSRGTTFSYMQNAYIFCHPVTGMNRERLLFFFSVPAPKLPSTRASLDALSAGEASSLSVLRMYSSFSSPFHILE